MNATSTNRPGYTLDLSDKEIAVVETEGEYNVVISNAGYVQGYIWNYGPDGKRLVGNQKIVSAAEIEAEGFALPTEWDVQQWTREEFR